MLHLCCFRPQVQNLFSMHGKPVTSKLTCLLIKLYEVTLFVDYCFIVTFCECRWGEVVENPFHCSTRQLKPSFENVRHAHQVSFHCYTVFSKCKKTFYLLYCCSHTQSTELANQDIQTLRAWKCRKCYRHQSWP